MSQEKLNHRQNSLHRHSERVEVRFGKAHQCLDRSSSMSAEDK